MNQQISKFITKQTAKASNKAFSRFEVKNLDDGTRMLKGIASTPTPDRVGDTVVPEGIRFKTPFPLLWQHDPSKPIGTVNKMTVTAAGAEVEATIAPPGTAAYIDEAYNLIKAGLVPGLSIGFRPLDAVYDKATGGFLIKSCELYELSAVTIPANADAAVQSIKAHDKSRVGAPVVRLNAPIIKEHDMTIAERLKALAKKRAEHIVAITEELARFSTPSAEGVIQQDLISTISQFLDGQFIDPAVEAGANGLSPASITNGIKAIPASGKDAEAVRADVKKVFQAYIAANLSVAGAVWIMSETTALALSLMLNVMGQPEFPGLTMAGGTFFGLPAILSQTAGNNIVLAKASEILFADDGGVTLDVSREASLQMDSAPVAGATELVSLWQSGFIALKAERFINWKRRRLEGVQYISGAAYGDAATDGA
ncbi:hypothetical protein BDI4_300050 [Burkholderia diffusa]|uniref:phage major capsid protein n=1 Tax=Burkholderia diffusa TaxID=488732 RepID=UPI001CB3F4D9|nr:phage major capsid protein [Burkholderia diffusa]CAG9251365.1 hypothetical protein BDI4_300050 [Burkholderia diffusa]